ncbi:MAG: hypothetical protein C4348_02030, partial [Patescibacteria group bacterium]
ADCDGIKIIKPEDFASASLENKKQYAQLIKDYQIKSKIAKQKIKISSNQKPSIFNFLFSFIKPKEINLLFEK